MCDVKIPNPGQFIYPGKCPYPGFLSIGILHNLIPGLPYPGKSPYPVIYSIHTSVHLLKINNNQNQK